MNKDVYEVDWFMDGDNEMVMVGDDYNDQEVLSIKCHKKPNNESVTYAHLSESGWVEVQRSKF